MKIRIICMDKDFGMNCVLSQSIKVQQLVRIGPVIVMKYYRLQAGNKQVSSLQAVTKALCRSPDFRVSTQDAGVKGPTSAWTPNK